ncbi:replicative DNA helicase [Nocardioides rotundus]|nr:replicative DNA helicase [Nocardioides rotundus]UAL32134.1 replicative DNA helicase [Nocardioides rotundus]
MPWEPGDAPGGGSGGDRTPPQDMAAEQCVLGSMMISKDAIAEVAEVLRGLDFYRPSHELIYDAMIDLWGRSEPVDAITVGGELQRKGLLPKIGGAPYLHTLIANVPTAANAGWYAEIVREKAILRRLVEAGTRIVQIGYAGEGQVDDVVDEAQAEIYNVTEKRQAEDYAPLSDIMGSVLDEIEAISNRDAGLYGVPTGFADLDELTNGLHAGQMIIVAARPAMGKALALDTPLPTPTGWTTMGEIRVGDELYDASGRPTRVVAATEVLLDRPCYEVHFSDGSVITADAQHQWRLASSSATCGEAVVMGAGRPHVVTTAELAAAGDVCAIEMPGGSLVKVSEVRPVASVPVRCVQVDNEDHLYLAGPTGIPTHNSTLALDLCRAASIHNNLSSVFFSLEMTRAEITMRLLSAEAKVPLNHIRNGQMNDDDWQKLARKMGEVSSAPMFIDDSPNMTMMEIRAKARRLKQRHDLRLIVIDYMQLMTSGKKVESRQLEVSEFSRQIKLLAKELEVPVIALSQLNRGAEQRTDKRPMMSDLRESGCLSADTRLMRADTNAEITLGELMESGARDIPVWSLDDRLKLVPRTLTHAFPSGVKQTYELTLASGRRIQATGNHKFLTYDGWMPLSELTPGSRIGSLRHAPAPLQPVARDEDEIVALAESGPELDALPGWVFGLPKEQVGLFLRHIWATEGSIGYDEKRHLGRVYYASNSRRLVDDLSRLLLRFNVFTRIKRVRKQGYRDGWHLHVYGAENQLRFCEEVGVHGARGVKAERLADLLRDVKGNPNLDTVPREVWGRLREVLAEHRPTPELAAVGASSPVELVETQQTPSRQRLAKVADVLGSADLEVLATNDVYWDAIAAIEPLGEVPVYDATVMGTHNFVVNGIAAHNSLEQDADMVILLHRDDVYEKESTRPGEADLIVAKHRNGPTRDLVVAFQGHYSRFVDMAH